MLLNIKYVWKGWDCVTLQTNNFMLKTCLYKEKMSLKCNNKSQTLT